jgi:hypothetical protein
MRIVSAVSKVFRRGANPALITAIYFGLAGTLNASLGGIAALFNGQADWRLLVLISKVLLFGPVAGCLLGFFASLVILSFDVEQPGAVSTGKIWIKANWWGVAGALIGAGVGGYFANLGRYGVLQHVSEVLEIPVVGTGVIVGLLCGGLLGAVLGEVVIPTKSTHETESNGVYRNNFR